MQRYLEKAALYPPLIPDDPHPDLGIIVVIPAYAEKHLLLSLESLYKAFPPGLAVEVIVVLNEAERDPETVHAFHQKQKKSVEKWADRYTRTHFGIHCIHMVLPDRHAGVGLARKIGMDEGVRRLVQVNRSTGILVGFDADTLCEQNYFQVLEDYFSRNRQTQAASIYFEHPLGSDMYSREILSAITEYELHLRYYIDQQRQLLLPYAYHTIGSAFAVRAKAYCKEGGMNRRQAGEDFYFLHKYTNSGHYGEILDTCVIPSPRPSERVPFGTGRAVNERLDRNKAYTTYHPESFKVIQVLLQSINWQSGVYSNVSKEVPEALLNALNWADRLKEIETHTASPDSFRKRFFQWFDAFRLMKCLHWLEGHGFPRIQVGEAVRRAEPEPGRIDSLVSYLHFYREKQRIREYGRSGPPR